MLKTELKNIDPEDIEDLLVKVESSFDIKIVDGELAHIITFGQLCEYIANKIELQNTNDCTSQQAFYKLQDAISLAFQINRKAISPDLKLAEFLPRKHRRILTKNLQNHLGLKLNILRSPHWITVTLTAILFASLVIVIFDWLFGLSGLVFAIAGFYVADRTKNELDLQTVGQVAEKMTREHYLKSRRNPKTFNKNEIEKVLTDWFSKDLDVDKSKLTRDAILFVKE